jgi:hypothetical protein
MPNKFFLITACAIHADKYFDSIAKHSSLKVESFV